MNHLKPFIYGEEGQGMTEYGLTLGLIAIALFVIFGAIREHIMELFTHNVGVIGNEANEAISNNGRGSESVSIVDDEM